MFCDEYIVVLVVMFGLLYKVVLICIILYLYFKIKEKFMISYDMLIVGFLIDGKKMIVELSIRFFKVFILVLIFFLCYLIVFYILDGN